MNEAATRLHDYFLNLGAKDGMSDAYSHDLDEALAFERREMAEQIRVAVEDREQLYGPAPWDWDALLEEAAR